MQTNRHGRLSTQVVQEIVNAIDNGTYKAGDKLPTEYELIEKFDVSRTVIREAIANLRANSLIETRQGKGAFVLPKPTMDFQLRHTGGSAADELGYILDLRIAIEAETALMAAKNRTDKDLERIKTTIRQMQSLINEEKMPLQADLNFHYAIAIASQNPHFLGLLKYIDSNLVAQKQITPISRKILALREHEQICHAIEQRDPDAARAAMRLHLSSSRERLKARLNQ
ncbi:FadR/GntR family transcriptional regulator [Celerinatantimonas sp. MCCC 1A17872]|uniref:FadR/GntR family transcriptional regulator n=1 Tax=Celerinatantimonas sp. MCCC 1A17872 TaxID=3177514 RepID=UPI0038C46846